MTHWIIEKSQGFTKVGLFRISENLMTYAYLILSSQASVKLRITVCHCFQETDLQETAG